MANTLKYKKEIADNLPKMFENGESVVEVCVALGISRETFYDWCDKHKEFKRGYEQGLLLSQAWWERLGRAGSLGSQKINPATWIFNMKNRFKWTDRNQVESTNEVRVTQVNIIDDMSEDEQG